MDSTASRRRPAFAFVPSTADGSTGMESLYTHDEDGSETGTCVLAQLGSGALFAFLLGSLGFILTGDAQRSVLWLLGLWAGGALGTFATRGASGMETSSSDDAAHRGVLTATAAGAGAGAFLYWLLVPVLALDNLMASLATAGAAYASQGLATPHGRAQAHLQALAALQQGRRWLAEVVKGSLPSGASATAAAASGGIVQLGTAGGAQAVPTAAGPAAV